VGSANLAEKVADGTGEPRILTKADSSSLSPDGKSVAFSIRDLKTKDDLWVLSLEKDAKPVPLVQTPARERQPAISPDGGYVAYISDESGRDEIYLTRFPSGGGKWQVSIDGGVVPVWARKSGELFFRNGNDLMVVDVTVRPSLTLGSPRKLFSGTAAGLMLTPGRRFDVAPDGQRILAIQGVGEQTAEAGITLVENWIAEAAKPRP
jgi:dipeptidyl aminopeptidase/acylaminoacyl peptidase